MDKAKFDHLTVELSLIYMNMILAKINGYKNLDSLTIDDVYEYLGHLTSAQVSMLEQVLDALEMRETDQVLFYYLFMTISEKVDSYTIQFQLDDMKYLEEYEYIKGIYFNLIYSDVEMITNDNSF